MDFLSPKLAHNELIFIAFSMQDCGARLRTVTQASAQRRKAASTSTFTEKEGSKGRDQGCSATAGGSGGTRTKSDRASGVCPVSVFERVRCGGSDLECTGGDVCDALSLSDSWCTHFSDLDCTGGDVWCHQGFGSLAPK